MDFISTGSTRVPGVSIPWILPTRSSFSNPYGSIRTFQFSFTASPLPRALNKSYSLYAKKRKSQSSEPVLKPKTVVKTSLDELVEEDEGGEEQIPSDFDDDEVLMDDDSYFEDDYIESETELYVGDGGGGGGIKLAGTLWDKEALAIAQEVCRSFDGNLKLYAFKTLPNSAIQVRIETLTNRSGSPSIEDIEAFSKAYRERLDEGELAKSLPENISLEVSSPGVERVVQIPEDLDRFKERPMYVKYVSQVAATGSSTESDGIFSLVSFDIETKCCIWGIANVRVNREKAGKGRPLNKKQKDFRLSTTFDALRLVRIYSDL